jgi:signal transduction histidine kinase
MSGRLIAAQEDDRSRIARQLHDDLSQRLAVLSMGLSSLRAHLPANEHAALAAIQRQAIELSNEIRQLSHELHPEVLRHAGLISALRQYCRELADQGKLRVSFHAPPGLAVPASDVAFCLFRVTQEALRNSIRHAGPCEASVALEPRGERLRLTVSDNGRGFEVASARSGRGIGLASMEERVRAVDGMLVLSSKVGRGTEVSVEAPLTRVDHASPETRPRG